MQITPTLLPHIVFYEALAALDESDDAWNPTVAGLLALRLFDTWCEMVRRGEQVQDWEVTGVAEAVSALPTSHPAHAALVAVVHAVRVPGASPARFLPHLASYARSLRLDAQWMLAADVFSTILTNGHGADEDVVIAAAFQRGYCLRMAGLIDAAAASYDEGRMLAAAYGNEAGMLEADVSHAALALHRGNLPAAQALLDGVIERANPVTCPRVLARAFHERATLAARRGHSEEAVLFGYKALPLYDSPADRDRVLGDMAAALGASGQHEAAWDAHLILAATAQEQETRWAATTNLIELAAWQNNERLFDRFRDELAAATLPAWLTGYYHLHVGDGLLRFGRGAEAVDVLRDAVAVATSTGLNEVRIKAEDMLSRIDRAPTTVRARTTPASPAIREVCAAVRTMRELAGVSAE